MNAYQLPDYHGNTYMIESEIDPEGFQQLVHNFCGDKYSKYKGSYHKTEIHFEALGELAVELEEKGYKTRVIKPVLEYHIWVWD